jgi:N-acetylglucosamine kinase-like BadF-type ATPase
VLGLDAGGTKTVCVLADARGCVLAEARAPGINLQAVGEARVEEVVRQVVNEVTTDRYPIDAICVGIAGADREDDAAIVARILRRVTAGPRIIIVNDALIALVAGSGDLPGIVVIAGTGSIAYGRNQSAQAARAGGWGHMIGDEGSGYWIGRRALTAVVREVDGRGPATRLTPDVLAHFEVADAAGLVRIVYNLESPRTSVARLGPLVQRACEQGDAVASAILERASEELALAARSVATRLNMRGEPFRFVLSGSVFRVVPRLAAELEKRLVEVAPRSDVRLLSVEPAMGAVTLALAEARGGAAIPQYL